MVMMMRMLMMMMTMLMIIMIMMTVIAITGMTLKGEIRGFYNLNAPRPRPSGQGAIVFKTRATHLTRITCSTWCAMWCEGTA